MPPQVTCAYALPGKTGEHENHICTQSNICWDSKIVY